MFKTRLISGIVLVALALALIITGGNILLTSTAVIALIGMFELYRIFHIERTIAGIAGFLAAVLFYCNLKFALIPRYDDVCDRISGRSDVYLCVFLPKISYRADACGIFRCVLCGSHAVLYLPDQNASAGRVYRMADLSVLLGL